MATPLQRRLIYGMQICMKLPLEARQELVRAIQAQVAARGTTYSEIAAATAVNVGQVSRICRGSFRTASFNVMQICNFLGVTISGGTACEGIVDVHRLRLERGVVAIWDRTPEDADRIVRLLRQIAELRGMR